MREKVVEHLTFSKVVKLFTTIKMCKKTILTKQINILWLLYYIFCYLNLQATLMINIKAFVFLHKSYKFPLA